MRRRRERPITMCPKCNQIKVEGRMLVGLGWIVCECDKPPVIDNKSQQEKKNEPFVPKFD